MEDLHDRIRRAWEHNAAFWDEGMAEGNDWVRLLVGPATDRLLEVRSGERLLDVACGNGVMARRYRALGADVTGVDVSAPLIELARRRSEGLGIRYLTGDATDPTTLAELGPHDAVLCSMALFDMAEIEPLFRAVPHLLRPGGRFVFSLTHPCFNNPWTVQFAEQEDRDGSLVDVYGVKVTRYRSTAVREGLAMPGQPVPHPYVHRALSTVLGTGFAAGLVLDGLEEPTFPPTYRGGGTPLSWNGRYAELPTVLVARMRPV